VTRQLARYAADALLRDGGSIHIRAIRADDKERLQAHFHGLGFDSVRFRFLGGKKDLTPADLRYFTELDFSQHVGLVALRRQDGAEEFIGVGRYICAEDDHRRAEFALAVVDVHERGQCRGDGVWRSLNVSRTLHHAAGSCGSWQSRRYPCSGQRSRLKALLRSAAPSRSRAP